MDQSERISYAIADSPLGKLLVATTDRGICYVTVGDTDSETESSLRRQYPASDMIRNDAQLEGPVATIMSHLRGEQQHLDLPLDVRATDFQRRVWHALQRIPYGSTLSYSGVARALGRPAAARAVARACASNPVPLVVPCHRVIRKDGTLGGFGLGIHRKNALLERERAGTRTKSGVP
ncbi:MAG: methylated-DNA--[protein]-cysteine S-methyltransferase [Gemmatimonadaceae bacterium]